MKAIKIFSGLLICSAFMLTLHGAYSPDKWEYKRRDPKFCYHPKPTENFRLSRSKIEEYLKCKRCFYRDVRRGIPQPPPYPYTLNNATDTKLKRYFDKYRGLKDKDDKAIMVPLLVKHGLELVPYPHKKMKTWQDALHAGIEYNVPGTNLTITGGPDEILMDPRTYELYFVDYKACYKYEKNSLKPRTITIDDIYPSYKRQIEIYQWLLRHNGFFEVSNRAYFLYCNARTDNDEFDDQLPFDVSLVPYDGNTSWINSKIKEIYACLQSDDLPDSSPDCAYCKYLRFVNNSENTK
jgi:hypothetical protein